MNPIRAIIVDDEETGWQTLRNMLAEHCPEVQVIEIATSAAEAIQFINNHKPDMVFLDISMPDGDGFRVLENTPGLNYEVIFVTAHHEYAVKAFEISALHYLLKPVNINELYAVLERYRSKKDPEMLPERLDIFKTAMRDQFHRIALPTQDSIIFVEIDDIVRCEASHNYTVIYLKDKSHVVMSKSLRHYESLLANFHFFRIHDKHLVNLKYVVRYQRGKGGSAVLTDGNELEVSVRKKDDFLKKISMHIQSI